MHHLWMQILRVLESHWMIRSESGGIIWRVRSGNVIAETEPGEAGFGARTEGWMVTQRWIVLKDSTSVLNLRQIAAGSWWAGYRLDQTNRWRLNPKWGARSWMSCTVAAVGRALAQQPGQSFCPDGKLECIYTEHGRVIAKSLASTNGQNVQSVTAGLWVYRVSKCWLVSDGSQCWG